MARNRLSSAARKACAAAGRRNLDEWRTRREQAIRERMELATAFRAELLAEIGPNPSMAAKVLVESAVAGHLAIATFNRRFIQGRTGPEQLDALTRVQGQLNRTLRLLGVQFLNASANNDDPSKPVRGGLAEYVATLAARRAASAPDTGQGETEE